MYPYSIRINSLIHLNRVKMSSPTKLEDQENNPPGAVIYSASEGDDMAPEKPVYERTLQRLLREGVLSDVRVLAGEKDTVFDLHRCVIGYHSEYFRVALNGPFLESATNDVYLPSLHPEVFNIVVQWMYDGGLQIDGRTLAVVHAAFQAAEYLQIPPLQAEIYERILAAVPWAGEGPPGEGDGRASENAPREFREFGLLPARGGGREEDKIKLKTYAKRMAEDGLFSRVTAKKYGEDTVDFAMFLAGFSRRLERTLNRITCGGCQDMIEQDRNANCDKCVLCDENKPRKVTLAYEKLCEERFREGYEAEKALRLRDVDGEPVAKPVAKFLD
ncbi:hypothetical protein Dda_9232 [Drechslerella dactyloides]|uniref:BTB domain-containing protein n=1 Tax=Drechslerella dactyloides TaxID=74499 RepID=A0AAD6NEJ3_DREDA|nr:hypothetical protein Dda_9232 [Drechslerella dactyloides]